MPIVTELATYLIDLRVLLVAKTSATALPPSIRRLFQKRLQKRAANKKLAVKLAVALTRGEYADGMLEEQSTAPACGQ